MHYAGFWLRFCATLVDAFCLLPFLIAGYFLLAFYSIGPSFFERFATVQVIGAIVTPWVYDAAFESGPWQATPGKRLLGLIVTDESGGRISFGRASARHFAKVISTITFFVGYIIAGFTDKKQALHDLVCNTLVLKGLKFEVENKRNPGELDRKISVVGFNYDKKIDQQHSSWVFAGFCDDGHILRIAFEENDSRLSSRGITIGRDPSLVDFIVPGPSVSRAHARFRINQTSLAIEDLNSTNGTLMNSNVVKPGTLQLVPPNGTLVLGNIELSIGRY